MGPRGSGVVVVLLGLALPKACPASDEAQQGSGAGRVGAELLGTLGGAAATGAVAIGGALLFVGDCDSDMCGAGAAAAFGVVGVGSGLFLIPLGTYLGGNAAGGDGSYWATFGGNAGGALAGGLLSIPAFNTKQETAGILIISGGVLIGNIMGYEASVWARARERMSTVRVVPLLSLRRSATLVGVAGDF